MGDRPLLALRSAYSPPCTLKVLQGRCSPQPVPYAIFTLGAQCRCWQPGRRGLTKLGPAGLGWPVTRVLAAPAAGGEIQRAGAAGPSRRPPCSLPAACSARGMAPRKGEAPVCPSHSLQGLAGPVSLSPLRQGLPTGKAQLGVGRGLWEPMGECGHSGWWGPRCAPENCCCLLPSHQAYSAGEDRLPTPPPSGLAQTLH